MVGNIAHNLKNNVRIQFGYTMGSDESHSFTIDLADFLFSRGYNNISSWLNPTFGNNSLKFLIMMVKYLLMLV